MLDKSKIINRLEEIIESCAGYDEVIVWQCKQMLQRIELGKFDEGENEK